MSAGRVLTALVVITLTVAARGPAVFAQAQTQAPPWPKMSMPSPLPARSISFPPYQIKTLSNGLQVLVVLHH